MKSIVLDASAVLAVLRAEVGAETVFERLPVSAISAINFGEVVGALTRDGISEPLIRAMLNELAMEVVPLDGDTAFEAGLMIGVTRSAGLSLGDRACLAFARRTAMKVLTADRAWARIADAVGVEVELIR